MTPVCPQCGSVKVGKASGSNVAPKRGMVCLESDCEHVGSRNTFTRGGPSTGQSYHTNDHWRDPVALSMDGYEE